MATIVTVEGGKRVVLLNPAERSKRYARELKNGRNMISGEPLTAAQAGFRIGVLNERKLQAKIYRKKHSGKKKQGVKKGKR